MVRKRLHFLAICGRPEDLIMKAPPHLKKTDYLVLESTYGDRLHDKGDAIEALGNAVNQTIKRGAGSDDSVLCSRTNANDFVLFVSTQAKENIPEIPIYLDSPMAIKVTSLLCTFLKSIRCHQRSVRMSVRWLTYTNTADESKKLDHLTHPAILVAGSGMADGGRVIHHLQHFIADAHNTILFVGFQAKGTTGYELTSGAKHYQNIWHILSGTCRYQNDGHAFCARRL